MLTLTKQHFALCILLAALLVPWLNPFTSGPSPAVLPWLVSAACAVAVWLFSARLTVQTVAISWLLAAWVSALLGLLQYFGQTQGLAPWVHATALGEAFANLRQRNQFATLTSIGLLALLWQVARWHGKPVTNAAKASKAPNDLNASNDSNATNVASSATAPKARLSTGVMLLMGSGAILLALGNAASGSRTGLLQWLLVAGLTWLWAMRSPRGPRTVAGMALFALLVYAIAVLALPWALQALTGVESAGLLGRFEEVAGCSSRRVLWANVLHLIGQKPWLGWGWGNLDYAHFITLYPGERFCEILDNAHNLPLHLAVELGVPVAVVFCTLCVWLIWRNKPWAETDPARQMAWGVLAVIGLHSLLEYPLWYGPFQLAAALCVWLLSQRPTPGHLKAKLPLVLARNAWIAMLLIACCAYAGWDYWRISQIYLPPAARNAAYRADTLAKIQGSWLFRDQVRFAELTTTSLTPDNAAHLNALAKDMLHFSPESRVVEKVIESATMLGDDTQALFYLQRYKAAFPEQHARRSAELAH